VVVTDEISSHTKLSAGIVASLNVVMDSPVVVFVVVVPPVTTSLPVKLLLVECLRVQVTEGVPVPIRTTFSSVIVRASFVKNNVTSSVPSGFAIVIALGAGSPVAPVVPCEPVKPVPCEPVNPIDPVYPIEPVNPVTPWSPVVP